MRLFINWLPLTSSVQIMVNVKHSGLNFGRNTCFLSKIRPTVYEKTFPAVCFCAILRKIVQRFQELLENEQLFSKNAGDGELPLFQGSNHAKDRLPHTYCERSDP